MDILIVLVSFLLCLMAGIAWSLFEGPDHKKWELEVRKQQQRTRNTAKNIRKYL